MKVLLFSTQWPEYMVELANALAKKTKVVLMVPENHRFQEEHRSLLSAEVKLVTFRLVLFKSIRQNFRMLSSIVRTLWSERPDILHVQANGHRLFYWVAFAKPFKTKIVNTIHDPEKHAGDKLSLAIDDSSVVRLMRLFTKKYIVHGPNLVSELAHSYRIDEKRIVSIPQGHFEIYKRLQKGQPVQPDGFVLFFGRIWKYKGLEYFIRAANIVHKSMPDVQFCIAGKGESLGQYLKEIDHPGRFLIINERIPIERVGAIFESAAVVVLPYIEATQSGVIPLAYAYRKPVIASRVGAISDVVVDSETGFLVEPKSPGQIADKIVYLLQSPAERKRMGDSAYSYAMNELSWDRIADKTLEVYNEVTGNRNG
jgi:starch synthase